MSTVPPRSGIRKKNGGPILWEGLSVSDRGKEEPDPAIDNDFSGRNHGLLTSDGQCTVLDT